MTRSPRLTGPLGAVLGAFGGPIYWLHRRRELGAYDLGLIGAAAASVAVSPFAGVYYVDGRLMSAVALFGSMAILLLIGLKWRRLFGPSASRALATCVAVIVALFLVLASKTDFGEERDRRQQLTAVTRYFSPSELDVFREGATLDGIMEALNYRGNFLCAYRGDTGEEMTIVSFSIDEDVASRAAYDQMPMWAVFRERRFEKFVAYVGAEMEKYEWRGFPASRHRKITVGENLERARKATEAKGLTTHAIRTEYSPRGAASSSSDVGFSLAILNRDRHLAALEPNARLRERFNGTLIRVGMERDVVEERFGPPQESTAEAGLTLCVYGSQERFDFFPTLHHDPVVVAYREDLVSSVFGYDFAWSLGHGMKSH